MIAKLKRSRPCYCWQSGSRKASAIASRRSAVARKIGLLGCTSELLCAQAIFLVLIAQHSDKSRSRRLALMLARDLPGRIATSPIVSSLCALVRLSGLEDRAL